MDALPQEPSIAVAPVASAAVTGVASEAEAQAALENIRKAFPRTRFESAWPSALPGFVGLRLGNGDVAYTDKKGRYLMLGLVIDSVAGTVLDRKLEGRPE